MQLHVRPDHKRCLQEGPYQWIVFPAGQMNHEQCVFSVGKGRQGQRPGGFTLEGVLFPQQGHPDTGLQDGASDRCAVKGGHRVEFEAFVGEELVQD